MKTEHKQNQCEQATMQSQCLFPRSVLVLGMPAGIHASHGFRGLLVSDLPTRRQIRTRIRHVNGFGGNAGEDTPPVFVRGKS